MADARPLTEPEARSLAFARVVVEKLRENPETVLSVARQNMDLRRARRDHHSDYYLNAWEQLIEGPPDELEEALLSLSQRSRDLRPTGPFAGVLSDSERLSILEQVYFEYHDRHLSFSPEFRESLQQMRRGGGRQVRSKESVGQAGLCAQPTDAGTIRDDKGAP